MDDKPDDPVEAAALDAERLAEAIRKGDGGLDPVYGWLDAFVAETEAAGYGAEDMLPAGAEPGLGLFRDKREGRTLWQAIAYAGRASLCDPEGEGRRRIQHAMGGAAGTGSLITALLGTLGLPLIAIPVAVAIAAVILTVGVDGFCAWISRPPDEPAPA